MKFDINKIFLKRKAKVGIAFGGGGCTPWSNKGF